MSAAVTAAPEQEYPWASRLLGGYYHQDWDLDDPDPDTAVGRFLAASAPGTAGELIAELDRLRARLGPLGDEAALGALYGMGCEFYPPGSGLTVDAWLAHLQQLAAGG